MRFLPVLALFLLLLSGGAAPSMAQSPDSADPAATPAPAPAQAPAGADNGWMQYSDPYAAEQNDLSSPHRSTDEIVAWTESTLTDALSFSPKTFAEHLAEIKKSFTQKGWYEYATWMKESKMVGMIRDQNYNISTIINGNASIVNSASSGGVYHWLVSAPLIITLTYDDPAGDPAPVPGGSYRALIQLGRASAETNDDGIVIESWKVVSTAR